MEVTMEALALVVYFIAALCALTTAVFVGVFLAVVIKEFVERRRTNG
jgi:ABC-type phosphate transport system permease subunit